MGLTNLDRLSLSGVEIFGNTGFMAMSGGKVYFVDPQLGSDGNDGSSANPKASLSNSDSTGAYDLCVSGRGDIIVLKGGPTSTSTTGHTLRLSSTFTWAKNNTHLIGLCSPVDYGQRARITGPSSGGTFSPVMIVSASGCRFENFSIFDDYTVDPVALKVTGSRNYFGNVNLQGMGAATGADDAAGASLWLYGASENLFQRCVIGLDTIPRSAANAEILIAQNASAAACTRNKFVDCHIKSYCDSATHLFVNVAASGDIDRALTFIRCVFENAPTGFASGLTMTNGMAIAASAGGYVILKDCDFYGCTDVSSADSRGVYSAAAAPTAGTSCLGIALTR